MLLRLALFLNFKPKISLMVVQNCSNKKRVYCVFLTIGDFIQHLQCTFSYIFYVRKTHALFTTETDKNGYANFAGFACTQHL